MKLTINRITLLFGLILFLNFLFFNSVISEYIIAVIFGVCAVLGIHNRKPDKPYTYGRGVLIGFRILFLGIIYSLLFLLTVSFIKAFKPLINSDGRSVFESTQDSLTFLFHKIAYNLPSMIVISIISLVLMFIIPLFFIRKSKQTNDVIDADLMDNEQT